MRFNRREAVDDIHIELTSMTDIVFLLLIFFMISTTFVDLSRQLHIQLPETHAGEATPEVQRHMIEMSAQGEIQLDGQSVQRQEILQRLRSGRPGVQPRSVIIRADKRLPYGEVMVVVGLVRQAHVSDIAVAVR